MPYNYGNYVSGGAYQPQMMAPQNTQTGQYYQMPNQQPVVTPIPTVQAQPYQQPQPSTNNGFVWVQGEAGAKAYPVGSGNTVLLMDSENPVLYIKSTDNSGRPFPMETYDLVKRENSPGGNFEKQSVDLSAYVKKTEINEMLESMVQKAVDEALAK